MDASWGRLPCSVIVTLDCMRHVSEPTVSFPLTAIPATSRVMPITFSPMISSDDGGMSISPNLVGTDCRITTRVFGGTLIDCPGRGENKEIQSTNPSSL